MELNVTVIKLNTGKTLYENLYTYYLKQRKITSSNIIKVHFHILPTDICSSDGKIFTHSYIIDFLWWEWLTSCGVDAVIELPSKQIYSHNAENQPECKTNQKYVHNGWDCSSKSIHNNLVNKHRKKNKTST